MRVFRKPGAVFSQETAPHAGIARREPPGIVPVQFWLMSWVKSIPN